MRKDDIKAFVMAAESLVWYSRSVSQRRKATTRCVVSNWTGICLHFVVSLISGKKENKVGGILIL